MFGDSLATKCLPLFIMAAACIGFAFNWSQAEGDAPTEMRPNIIFIMSDDHAEKAISSYGHGLNHTPNIDRLAEEGVRFTQACVSNSICAPSRAVILTGKHSHMNGLVNNASVFDGSQQTFPKLLQQAGYHTAVIGKWHLKSEPTGFDYWKVLPGQGHYYNPDFNEMGQVKQEQGYVTKLITDFSLDWLESVADSEKPFCLLLQHKAPHRNWMPALAKINCFDSVNFPLPPSYFDDYAHGGKAVKEQQMMVARDLYPGYDLKLTDGPNSDQLSTDGMDWCYQRMDSSQRCQWTEAYHKKNTTFYESGFKGKELALWKYQRYMQDYLSTIVSVDESVGSILDFLDAHGLTENTIVVYTSDQGFYLGEHGWFDKRFMYEESLRTPFLIRYPQGIGAGWVSDALVQNLDFAETLLDYAGVSIPDDMQGLSLRPILNQEVVHWRDAIYYHYYEYPAEHAVKRHYGIRTPRYKLIHFYFDVDEWELYDLDSDPEELHNLYGKPAYEKLTIDLKKRLIELKTNYEVTDFKTELAQRADTIQHLGIAADYRLFTKPAAKYYPSDTSLNDGIVYENSAYWSRAYDYFCGYEGGDMLVKIDLGEAKTLTHIGCRFLSRPGSWIYEPSKVRLSVSADGRSYSSLMADILEIDGDIITYGTQALLQPVRYIKIDARNHGLISPGLAGAGHKAWLFCDEVIIE